MTFYRFPLLFGLVSVATVAIELAFGCSSTTEEDGTRDAGTDASGADTSTCLSDNGVVPSCEKAEPTCAPICERYLTNYKRAVARAIIDCVARLPSCADAAATTIETCFENGLGTACEDPTAALFCAPLVGDCADGGASGAEAFTQADCEELANGLSDEGRKTLLACVTDGTPGHCTEDPTSCFDLIQ